jgi:hypothetical protein
MSTDTTTEALVNPRELDSFQTISKAIDRAREVADRLPAEFTDREQAGAASDAAKQLRHAREDAEKARKEEKRPFADAGARIDADFKELQSTVLAAEKSIKDRLTAFEEAEEARHEEERKKEERNRKARQDRENKKAEEQNRRAKAIAPTPPPMPPPSGARGQMSKASVRMEWKYDITSEAELPDEYLTKTPNRKLIKAHVEAGVAIPGVRAWQEKNVAIR